MPTIAQARQSTTRITNYAKLRDEVRKNALLKSGHSHLQSKFSDSDWSFENWDRF